MAYGWGYGFPEYVPVAEKRARARRKLEQLRKKHPNIHPILIEGNALAKTWWGKAWNSNLTKYADFENRVGRGRSYLRHGAVLDLKITPGQVEALVQGSQSSPYEITIKIKPLGRSVWKQIRTASEGQLASLQELLEGRFPKGLADLFTAKGSGLFPAPKEIEFDCSCPDWAYMCKHVAAVLYGIGTRLDEDPSLFFVLRKMKMEELIGQAVQDRSAKLLKQAKKKTSRVIADADLGDVFGIEMEPADADGQSKPPAGKTPKKRARSTTPANRKTKERRQGKGEEMTVRPRRKGMARD
jgi:uncharacterized Zn finger protein